MPKDEISKGLGKQLSQMTMFHEIKSFTYDDSDMDFGKINALADITSQDQVEPIAAFYGLVNIMLQGYAYARSNIHTLMKGRWLTMDQRTYKKYGNIFLTTLGYNTTAPGPFVEEQPLYTEMKVIQEEIISLKGNSNSGDQSLEFRYRKEFESLFKRLDEGFGLDIWKLIEAYGNIGKMSYNQKKGLFLMEKTIHAPNISQVEEIALKIDITKKTLDYLIKTQDSALKLQELGGG